MKLVRISVIAATAVMALSLTVPGVAQARRHHDQSKHSSQYPNATRKAPRLDMNNRDVQKRLKKGLDAAQQGDTVKADELLSPIAGGRTNDGSKYAQALAMQGLATMKFNAGDHADGIKLLKGALDNGVLPNDTYFQLMYELAQFYVADGQYKNSLAALQKWRAEGKRETAQSYALEGNIDYRLEKYPQAIAALKKAKSMADKPDPQWDRLLAASYANSGKSDEALSMAKANLAQNPDDAGTMRNVAVLLSQTDNFQEAQKLYQDGIAKGILDQAKDYNNLARVDLSIAQNQDDPSANVAKAIKVLDDGVAKGVLKPGYDLYKLQGDASSIGMKPKQALSYYTKAEPYAKDGEIAKRKAQMYLNLDQNKSAAKAAQKAIDKGVKNMGEAYMLLGAAQVARHKRSAATAAMKKAASYPETKARANAWLKKSGD